MNKPWAASLTGSLPAQAATTWNGSNGSPGKQAVIVDPGEEVTKARLADPVTGELSDGMRQGASTLVRVKLWKFDPFPWSFVKMRPDVRPGRLMGTVLTYGERASDRAEIFETGALTWPADGVVLNRQHERGAPIMRVTPEVRGDGRRD